MSFAITTTMAAAGIARGLPLDELVEQLGETVGRLRVPRNQGPRVLGVSYYDADTAEPPSPGHLLLLTSASVLPKQQLDAAFAFAAEQGHSAVVCKGVPEGDNALTEAANTHGVALVSLSVSISWRQLDALVSRLLAEYDSGLHLAPSASDRLFALANTVASVFGGSVAIEDHRRNMLAYSAMPGQAIDDLRANGILYRRTPDAPLNEIRYREVFASTGISRFSQQQGEAHRAAVAIRAGNIPLGSIWVIDPDGHDLDIPLSEEKQEVLTRAAILAARYLVDAWRTDNSSDRPREESFLRLINGTANQNELTTLGLRPKQFVTLAAVSSASHRLDAAELNDLRFAVHRHVSVYFPGSITITQNDAVLTLLPTGSSEEARRVFRQLLPELVRASAQEWRVGVGEPRRFSGTLTRQRDEAVGVLECARIRGLDVATLDEVRPQLVLLGCQGQLVDQRHLIDPELAALLDGDTARDEEARLTLLVWCEEQGNASRVADRLNIHEQTVRYRIRQLRERITLHPKDPDALLALWLQLRLHALGKGDEPGKKRG
ncbi:PucR family transcriptional regulator [Paeniglutamicibacter sp. NPDC012692]|uniref:PucR family transcriptional regulator n=1 Tax=Paeniglutamicibacter sp. NPDC012692 TaxID=3364388 RepID=UPI00367744DF